jgi:hypothetical protein
MNADIKTLERLAERLENDAKHFHALHPSAMCSVAGIIRRSIGAPLMWPSRTEGANAADEIFSGDPTARHAFNWGVKWAVEHYQGVDPTTTTNQSNKE